MTGVVDGLRALPGDLRDDPRAIATLVATVLSFWAAGVWLGDGSLVGCGVMLVVGLLNLRATDSLLEGEP